MPTNQSQSENQYQTEPPQFNAVSWITLVLICISVVILFFTLVQRGRYWAIVDTVSCLLPLLALIVSSSLHSLWLWLNNRSVGEEN